MWKTCRKTQTGETPMNCTECKALWILFLFTFAVSKFTHTIYQNGEIEWGLIFSLFFPPLPHSNPNVCGTIESRYDVLNFMIIWWFGGRLRIDQTTFEYYSWKWTRKCNRTHKRFLCYIMLCFLWHILIVHHNFLNSCFDKDHLTDQKKWYNISKIIPSLLCDI